MTDLSNLQINDTARIVEVGGSGANRQHFLDMGVIPGAIVRLNKFAPMGDPIEFKLHGYTLTLRKEDAKNINVEKIDTVLEERKQKRIKTAHPGLGETGAKYHDKKKENPLPDNQILSFALVGNQNAGKTSLFNRLTGSNQHIGNFPGVTVDKKEGPIVNHPNTVVVDLPGIYSMSPYSSEEIVSRDFVLDERPQGIINVVDATSIVRGLYLTMQLLELDIPMVLALNMMDEVKRNGGYIDINALEAALGIPVVAISAKKDEGIDELIEHAIHVAKYQEKPLLQDYCDPNDHNGAVHRCLHAIMHTIEDHAKSKQLPLRFCASKIAGGDNLILKKLALDKNEEEMIEHIIIQMEKERQLDNAAAIADMRYVFINKIITKSVFEPEETIEETRSNNIDKILTGKYTAIPAFILIMALVFFLTFNAIGPIFQNIIALGIDKLTIIVDNLLTSLNVNPALHSLVIDGAFKGVGSVLSFLPIVIILFFFLSILEDSGYMARIAFVMDRLLRKLGLSGRSIVPMLIGFGCTVPAVMSSRTLPSKRDRRMTILLTPFMSCSAKLPIYVFFVEEFFKEQATLIMIGLYLLGIVLAVVIALIFKKTLFKGEAAPFIMELPNYRLPSARNVFNLLWEKAKDFLQKAFTIIFIASIVIWFLENFGLNLSIVNNQEDSILAYIAGFIAPIFKPLGFGNWKIVVSLISGFMAKESVVSSLHVLFETKELLHSFLTNQAALSLLVFSSLYTPCVAAITAIKKEAGTIWAIFVILFQCLIAWIISFIVYSLITIL